MQHVVERIWGWLSAPASQAPDPYINMFWRPGPKGRPTYSARELASRGRRLERRAARALRRAGRRHPQRQPEEVGQ